MNKALFLDRDGVINIDYGHVYQIKDFVFTNDIFSVCEKYQREGYLIIVVSNQAGIAKGLYTQKDLDILDAYMIDEFRKKNIIINGTYYCPHHPDEHCECRKPKPGLILKAQKDFDIDLAHSTLIGDKMSDLEAGYQAGIRDLIFKKGNYKEESVSFPYTYL